MPLNTNETHAATYLVGTLNGRARTADLLRLYRVGGRRTREDLSAQGSTMNVVTIPNIP